MKKLVLIIGLLFVLASYASAQTAAQTTVAGYFTETTVPLKNNLIAGQNQYTYGITGTAVGAGDTTYAIATKPLGQNTVSTTNGVRNSLMGSKVAIGINISIAFADVNATLVTQISYDGTSWVTYETLDSDTTPNLTGIQSYVADFTSCKAPFVRLCFNAGNLQINKAGRIKFMYAIPN